MARLRKQEATAMVEGAVIEPEAPELSIEPTADEPIAMAPEQRVKVRITTLKIQTTEGRFIQGATVDLFEREANTLIAEGKAEPCR